MKYTAYRPCAVLAVPSPVELEREVGPGVGVGSWVPEEDIFSFSRVSPSCMGSG